MENIWKTNFYNSIFKTQCTPESLSKSIITPFVKSYKKTLKSFNNYSIIPIFTKILEYIILLKCPRITESHHLQYRYKELSSTFHAEFLIKETIQYYNKNNSPIYICGLDAEKAFDSCNWDILLPLSVTNVIKSLDKNSSAKVLYDGCVSEEFSL